MYKSGLTIISAETLIMLCPVQLSKRNSLRVSYHQYSYRPTPLWVIWLNTSLNLRPNTMFFVSGKNRNVAVEELARMSVQSFCTSSDQDCRNLGVKARMTTQLMSHSSALNIFWGDCDSGARWSQRRCCCCMATHNENCLNGGGWTDLLVVQLLSSLSPP